MFSGEVNGKSGQKWIKLGLEYFFIPLRFILPRIIQTSALSMLPRMVCKLILEWNTKKVLRKIIRNRTLTLYPPPPPPPFDIKKKSWGEEKAAIQFY